MFKSHIRFSLLVLAIPVVFMFPGCGPNIRYRFPVGKTIIYSVSDQTGALINKKEAYDIQRISMMVKIKTKQSFRGLYTMTFTAHPPFNRSDIFHGDILGTLDIKVDEKGNIIGDLGSGFPIPTRQFIPMIPKGVKTGSVWSEKVLVTYRRKDFKLDLTHKLEKEIKINGRPCIFISGKAHSSEKQSLNDPAQGVFVDMDFSFDYEENYCIDAARGWLIRTEILNKRRRKIFDKNAQATVMDTIDIDKRIIGLEGIE